MKTDLLEESLLYTPSVEPSILTTRKLKIFIEVTLE